MEQQYYESNKDNEILKKLDEILEELKKKPNYIPQPIIINPLPSYPSPNYIPYPTYPSPWITWSSGTISLNINEINNSGK